MFEPDIVLATPSPVWLTLHVDFKELPNTIVLVEMCTRCRVGLPCRSQTARGGRPLFFTDAVCSNCLNQWANKRDQEFDRGERWYVRIIYLEKNKIGKVMQG